VNGCNVIELYSGHFQKTHFTMLISFDGFRITLAESSLQSLESQVLCDLARQGCSEIGRLSGILNDSSKATAAKNVSR